MRHHPALRRSSLLAIGALVLLGAALAAAADWPQWRGPERTGKSAETGILKSWPEEGPEVLWRAPLGEGYSGISVVGDRLYTLYSTGDDEFAVCLDAATGKQVWRYRTGARYRDWQGNGPRATPTVHGGVVYVLGALGQLAALDARSGKKIWSRDLTKELGGRVPQWGVSTSPLVEGDLLIFDLGGPPGKSVAALRRATGEVAWTAGTDIPGYAAPIAIEAAGRRQVVAFTGTKVVGIDLADGRMLWETPWRTSYNVNAATPIFIGPDKLFVASGYDTGAAVLRLAAAEGGVRVDEVWRSREMKNQFSSSILHQGHLYGFDNATLKCLDAKSGEERWKTRGYGHGSLTYADGHLLVLSDRGELALVEATPAGFEKKASAQVLSGKCWTVPTLAGGRLFVRNEKEIVALKITG